MSGRSTRLDAVVESTLASYGQVLFSKHWLPGLLMLAATAITDPVMCLAGLAGVVLTNLLALALGMGAPAVRSGLFGINGLLVAVAATHWFEPTPLLAVALVIAMAAVVLITASLRTLLAQVLGLPVLSLPFVIVAYLLLVASPALPGLEPYPLPAPVFASGSGVAWFVETYLRALGFIFLRPEPLTGLFVLAALVAASRISAVLSLLGFALALLAQGVLSGGAGEVLGSGVALNAILISLALGGFFFVSGPWSLLLAGVSVLLGVLATTALHGVLQAFQLPLLILPFNITVLLVLYGMRQRLANRRPVQLDVLGDSPESSLYRHQTRVARFGWSLPIRFSLPFRGAWIVTQGWDGDETHQHAWRHGWDFEVAHGTRSRIFENGGEELTDYYCYKLPVLAPADGTVVTVVDDIDDNPIGEPDPVRNWGNVVVIQHPWGLFSVLAHLAPGSVKVSEGATVRRGEQVAVCGNSGRSSVPHLHVQLQATAVLGSPTLPGEFHDIVLETGGEEQRVFACHIPKKTQRVRNLVDEARVSNALRFPPRERWTFTVKLRDEEEVDETIVSEVTLLGDRRLRSEERGTTLTFANDSPLFLSLELEGDRDSVLSALHLALSRVPLELRPEVRWSDQLVLRPHRSAPLRWLYDGASPFGVAGWQAMSYMMRQKRGLTEISGRDTGRGGVETLARLNGQRGILEVQATAGAWKLHATRREAGRDDR